MKEKCYIFLLFGLFLITASMANAGIEITAVSPQAVNGEISFADADSFHIDIKINVIGGNTELCGGGIAFEFYSPDNSIETISHLPVTDGFTSTSSMEYLNNFNTDIFDVATVTMENGWGGSSESKSTGSLPDSLSLILAGINCLSSTLLDQEYIRFNLRCTTPGTICIDSISNAADDRWDWLFESRWDSVTFDGPYCWEVLSGVTDISETDNFALPEEFVLSQNYPNPFNPSTTIELALPRASEWNVSIYNVLGQRVEEFTGFNEAGIVSINWDASKQSSGIYFYKAVAGEFADTRKMILLK